jgi:hypothetical protein
MAETYEAKLARRLKMRATFSPPLHLVAIRHIDKIAALSADRQQLLGKAITQGLRSIPLALDRLETLGADATVDLLLQDNKSTATTQVPYAGDVETLIDVMTDCFPGTPALTIQSRAESAVIVLLRDNVLEVLRFMQKPPGLGFLSTAVLRANQKPWF